MQISGNWKTLFLGCLLCVLAPLAYGETDDDDLAIFSEKRDKLAVLSEQGKLQDALILFHELQRQFDKKSFFRELVFLNGSSLASEFVATQDFQNALSILDSLHQRNCVPVIAGMERLCEMALWQSIEPLIVLDKNFRVVDAIGNLQRNLPTWVHQEHQKKVHAELSFQLWLVQPKTSLSAVRDAIEAIPPNQIWWNEKFPKTMLRRHAATFPEPRRAQATCFFDYFEQHHDKARLDGCLSRAR
jgi:hypothetical protein